MLTGRADFDALRQAGGLSGYPSQAESEHDVIENSHASTALSYADGLAKAFQLRGERDRAVVAVIGDGALTGGMAWEALNNIAGGQGPPRRHRGQRQRPLLLADDRRAGRPPRRRCASTRGYEHALDLVKEHAARAPVVGASLYDALHGIKKGIKDVLQPQAMFEDLGLKYVGPIDGHDEQAVEARAAQGPRLRRPGHRALHHPEGPRLRARRERRRGLLPLAAARSTRPPAREQPKGGTAGPRSSARSWSRSARERARRRRHHRGDAAPDRAGAVRRGLPRPDLRRRHRRAARADLARPGWRSAGCTRSSPSTRRSSTAPSTSC